MGISSMFINIELTSETVDIYIVRKSIYEALLANLPLFHGTLLDLGCGEMPYKPVVLGEGSGVTTYIGLDLPNSTMYNKVQPDLVWDGNSIPLRSCSIDCVIATELFEHCPNLRIVMSEIVRVLKPGGSLFFTVPFVWPLHDVPYDYYRYTPFYLETNLRSSGFQQIDLRAMGGWDASLAQMLGLWVRRRPMAAIKRGLLALFVRPIIKYLLSKDLPVSTFGEGQMITGISGIARK